MKRLVLIIFAILSLATIQAQTYLKDGDIVSISFKDTPWQTYDYFL